MKKVFLFILGAALSDMSQGAAADEKAQAGAAIREIPLGTIWGNVSSEAKPPRKLEPEYFIYRDTPENIKKYESLTAQQIAETSGKAEKSYNIQIERAMRSLDPSKSKLRFGFAVDGQARKALKGIYDVLVKNEKPADHFKRDTELSIVFFSFPAQPLVCVERVELSHSTIAVNYSLISHGALSITSALAIIPMGEMRDDKYYVAMIRNPSNRDEAGFPPVAEKLEDQIICGNFEFVVGAEK